MSTHRLIWPVAFFICAAGTRLLLQHTIDTRYQILAYWCLALLIEAVMLSWGTGADIRRLLESGLAATAAMVIVRLMLEGLPEKLTRLFCE